MSDRQPSLSATTARYRTRNSIYVSTGAPWDPVVGENSQRWYLRVIKLTANVTGSYFYPGPVVDFTAFAASQDIPLEVKYRDAPSMVTGEWYGIASPGEKFLVTEVLFMG